MQCPNCQQDNSPTNLFCIRCASALGKQQVRLQNKSKVFMPPQTVADKRSTVQSSPFRGTGIILVLVGLAGLLWFWLYY